MLGKGGCALVVVLMPGFHVMLLTGPILISFEGKEKEGLTGSINHLTDVGS